MDNELYYAMREGRVPIRIEVNQLEDGRWSAKHDQFDIEVEVVDESQRFAHSEATRLVMEQVRDGKFAVKVA